MSICILNVDNNENGNYDYINVEHLTFPSGEEHIRISPSIVRYERVVLTTQNPNVSLMKLGMAMDICRRVGVKRVDLLLRFVPYARQDRVAVDSDPLSIRVFANFINSLNFDQVIIYDPHSDVTPALIHRCRVVSQFEIMAEALYGLIHDDPSITLVSPDDGASKKTEALQHYMMMRKSWRLRIIQCKKKRDPVSGKLTDFIISDGNPMKRHCVIVDDICDGGGTFLGLDKVLKEAGASKTSLLVTHGLFTQGTEKLTKVFDNVICTDSVFKTNSKGVRVLRELHL